MERRLIFWQGLIRRMIGRPVSVLFDDQCGLAIASGTAGFHTRCMGGAQIVLRRAAMTGDSFRDQLFIDSVLIHELSHEVISLEPAQNLAALEVQATVGKAWRMWPAHRGEPWAGHDLRFIRALLHCIHRAAGHGVRVYEPVAFGHRLYRLSSLKAYRAALGSEPAETDWLSLTEVLAKPAPSAFLELWVRDVLSWAAKHRVKGKRK